jgi:hypothetical protein
MSKSINLSIIYDDIMHLRLTVEKLEVNENYKLFERIFELPPELSTKIAGCITDVRLKWCLWQTCKGWKRIFEAPLSWKGVCVLLWTVQM